MRRLMFRPGRVGAGWRALACLVAGLTGAAPLLAAGVVRVTLVEPERFTDVGQDAVDTRSRLDELLKHLRLMGERQLAEGQTLDIEVLDVDRAGSLRPSVRQIGFVRVLRGTTDWPRIKLRYTLRSGETVLAGGEEIVQDMDYLGRIGRYPSSDGLRHEKRMLDQWFQQRFTALPAATH